MMDFYCNYSEMIYFRAEATRMLENKSFNRRWQLRVSPPMSPRGSSLCATPVVRVSLSSSSRVSHQRLECSITGRGAPWRRNHREGSILLNQGSVRRLSPLTSCPTRYINEIDSSVIKTNSV